MRTFAQNPKAALPTTAAESTLPVRAYRRHSGKPRSLLDSTRAIGNQAAPQGIDVHAEDGQAGRPKTTDIARFGHGFSRVQVYAPTPVRIQAKLTVNAPGDSYEQEADSVADQVMRMPEPHARRLRHNGDGVRVPTGVSPLSNAVSRMTAQRVQRMPGPETPSAQIEPTGAPAIPRVEILRPTDQKIADGIFQPAFSAAMGSALIMTPQNTTRVIQDEQINATLAWQNPPRGLLHRRAKGEEAADHAIHWEAPDRQHPELEIRDGAVVVQDTHIYSMAVMPGMEALNAAEAKGFSRDVADWRFALSFKAASAFDSPMGRANLNPWGFSLLVAQTVSKSGEASRAAQLEYSGVASTNPMIELPAIDFSPGAEP
ncbi:MAG TPA: hypothetical protein VFZ66_04260 [Herpetosiphonaceae bacterium]